MRALNTLLLCLPLVAFVYACEDDGGGGASGGFDGGAGVGFEAGPPTTPDAGPSDAAVPSEASVEGIVVVVREGGKPIADVSVLFHDASGAVTAELKTDAAGRVASKDVPSMVTVSRAIFEGPGALLTYLGVEKGDVLNVELGGGPPVNQTSVGSYDVSFTAPALPNTGGYEVHVNGDCIGGSDGSPSLLNVPLFPSCVRQSNLLYGVAKTSLGQTLGFAFNKGEPAPAANQTRAVQLPVWAAPQTTLVKATNAPVGTELGASFAVVTEGAVFVADDGTGSLGEGGVTYRWAQGFPDATSVRVKADANGSSRWLARRAAPTATADFDFASALPQITAVEATGAPRADVKITAAGSLASTDGGFVTLDWSRLDNNENFLRFRWTFVVPPATTTFKVPALPAALGGLAPSGTSTSAAAGFFESDGVPGYAQTRTLPTPLFGAPPQVDDGSEALPVNGTLRATLLGSLSFALD
jgi:hypothetical protein